MPEIRDIMPAFELIGLEARLAWELLLGSDSEATLREPDTPYGDPDRLDMLSARELLDLMYRVQGILQKKGCTIHPLADMADEPARTPGACTIHVSKDYRIFINCLGRKEIKLRALLKTVFILFLRHPEGIIIKERGFYRDELLEIYSQISPELDEDLRRQRIERLVSPDENTFSESISHLNRKLSAFPEQENPLLRIYGSNGKPRRINLNPMYVSWE